MTNKTKVNPAAIKAAKELGRKAFEAGKKRVPVQDSAVLPLIGKYNGHATEILDAWLSAWDEANLAAPVEGWSDEENDAWSKSRPSKGATTAMTNKDLQKRLAKVTKVLSAIKSASVDDVDFDDIVKGFADALASDPWVPWEGKCSHSHRRLPSGRGDRTSQLRLLRAWRDSRRSSYRLAISGKHIRGGGIGCSG